MKIRQTEIFFKDNYYILAHASCGSGEYNYKIFRNTDFNYLKHYNSGRKSDPCMKFAKIL